MVKDHNAVMAKDIDVRLCVYDHVLGEVSQIPRSPFNIQSAIQSLQQEHDDLTDEWADTLLPVKPHQQFALLKFTPNGINWLALGGNSVDLLEEAPDELLEDDDMYVIIEVVAHSRP